MNVRNSKKGAQEGIRGWKEIGKRLSYILISKTRKYIKIQIFFNASFHFFTVI